MFISRNGTTADYKLAGDICEIVLSRRMPLSFIDYLQNNGREVKNFQRTATASRIVIESHQIERSEELIKSYFNV